MTCWNTNYKENNIKTEVKFISVVSINHDIDFGETLNSYIIPDNLNVNIEEALINQLHELLMEDMCEDETASFTIVYSNVATNER